MKTTIRFQLLVAVNLSIAVFIVGFLAYDYHRELSERIKDKGIALEEEAKTLLPAVLRLGADEPAVQEYIDAVCSRMRNAQSPGHHIAVRHGATTLQASAHQRASDQMLQAMERAGQSASRRARLAEKELIVGAYSQGEVSVYVSEMMSNLRQSAFNDLMRRLVGSIFLAILAAFVINLVLLQVVARPLGRLVSTVRSIGQGQLGLQAGNFSSSELSYLAEAIDEMSTSLAAADRERATEMAKAKRIQQNLLPTDGDTPGLRLGHIYHPAADVAGDYFDFLPLPDGEQLLCVADVTGHGVPAAMTAAMLKTLLLQGVRLHTSPGEILQFVNRHFCQVTLPDDFATIILVRYTPESRSLEYASGGHETAWLLETTGQLHELRSTGTLVGVENDASWQTKTISVRPGDRLLMYTDGITEMFNVREELFGRQRLRELFAGSGELALDDVSSLIDRELSEFRGDLLPKDDVTLVLAEFAPN